jgi:hypothetical protein
MRNEAKCTADGIGYDLLQLENNVVCMPSNDESYQWGFSGMLTGVTVILQGVWTVLMWILYLYCSLSSELVRKGYAMSALRAAFAITAASEERVGLNATDLVVVDKKILANGKNGESPVDESSIRFELFDNELTSSLTESGNRDDSTMKRKRIWASARRFLGAKRKGNSSV